MNYELFRSTVISSLMDDFDMETIHKFIDKLDVVADGYDIKIKCTDIILANTIPEAVKYFIAAKAIKNAKKGTLQNYFSVLKHFFLFVKKPMEQITPNDIRSFLGKYKIEGKIKDSSIDGKRLILHNFFLWCYEEGLIQSNPSVHVDPIKYHDDIREPMDRDELEMMRDACKDVREKALVEFLYSTGLRVSEVGALKFEDVDFSKRTVTVQHGKGDKKRISYINSRAMIALKKYIKTRTDDCPYVFVNKRTREKHGIGKRAFEVEIKNIWQRTNINHKITPHIFRNTTGTLSAQNGMPIEQVQKLLGHESIKTTMRYVKVFDEDVKANHRKYTV